MKNDARKRERAERNSALKQEEKVIRAQKKRINQKQLVMSEFSTGFEGIELRESAKVPKVDKPKERKKNNRKFVRPSK